MRQLGLPRLVLSSLVLVSTPVAAAPNAPVAPVPKAPRPTVDVGRPPVPAAHPLVTPAAPTHVAVGQPAPVAARAPHVEPALHAAQLPQAARVVDRGGRDGAAEVAAYAKEIETLRPKVDTANAKLVAAAAARAAVAKRLDAAEKGGPGFFADVVSFGGASKRHVQTTAKLREELRAADDELAKADHAQKSVAGMVRAAEAKWKQANEALLAERSAPARAAPATKASTNEVATAARAPTPYRGARDAAQDYLNYPSVPNRTIETIAASYNQMSGSEKGEFLRANRGALGAAVEQEAARQKHIEEITAPTPAWSLPPGL